MSSPIRPGQAKGPSVGLSGKSGDPGTIETYDEGVLIDAVTAKVDFAGAGVVVTNPVAGRALVTVPGVSGAATSTIGITASPTHSQGQVPLTTTFNLIETCASPYDTVTLKPAVVGEIQVVANLGAQVIQIFPATGEYINTKPVNGSIILQPEETYTFHAVKNGRWMTHNQVNENILISHVMQQQTTDATETENANGSYRLDDDCLYNIEGVISGIAKNSAHHIAARFFVSAYRKDGGNAIMLGNVNYAMLDRSSDLMSIDVRQRPANPIQITTYLTGLAGVTIDWTGHFNIMRVRELA